MSTSIRPCFTTSASAPGKLILFGEHAVVYGEPAIAVALSDLRIQVDAIARDDGLLVIQMPHLTPKSLSYTVHAASILVPPPAFQAPPSATDAERIAHMLQQTSSSAASAQLSPEFISALTPLVYLLNLLVPSLLSPKYGVSLDVISHNLPSAAGLGSSAAFGVASSAALLKLQRDLIQSVSNTAVEFESNLTTWSQPSIEDLDLINSYSFYSERLIHGTPSGIDNAVSTFGGAIYFQKNVSDDTVTMENIITPPLCIILTNTNISRSTKLLVNKVRSLKERIPSTLNHIITAIGSISITLRQWIAEKNSHDFVDESLVSHMIRINQNLLCALGVSHKTIDAICRKTSDMYNEFKCTTKLTGAGGGGCVLTFIEHIDGESTHEFQRRLDQIQNTIEHMSVEEETSQFTCLFTNVGRQGVLWK